MKVDPETYQSILADMEAVFVGQTSERQQEMRDVMLNWPIFEKDAIWQMWGHISRQRMTSANINFGGVSRILNYDPSFTMYPCHTNRRTMTTALRKAWRELCDKHNIERGV